MNPEFAQLELSWAEYVLDGHPDKASDLVADALLDEYLRSDSDARVGCEVMIAKGAVLVAGEISTVTDVDIPAKVRQVLCDIGYNSSEAGLDANSADVSVSISRQSSGLNAAIEPTASG